MAYGTTNPASAQFVPDTATGTLLSRMRLFNQHPLMRVEEPTLSMVATRRCANSRSEGRAPKARQAPLNSLIPAISVRISGVMWRLSVRTMGQCYAQLHPINRGIHPELCTITAPRIWAAAKAKARESRPPLPVVLLWINPESALPSHRATALLSEEQHAERPLDD